MVRLFNSFMAADARPSAYLWLLDLASWELGGPPVPWRDLGLIEKAFADAEAAGFDL